MTPGSRNWRAAIGSIALMVAAPAGCHSVPVAKLAPTPNRPQTTIAEVGRAAFLPATVALEAPSEMASMEPVRSAQATEPSAKVASESRLMFPQAEAPATPPAAPADTPLLDAALERAKGIEEATVEAMTPEPTSLPPARPEPIAAPVASPPTPEPSRVEKVEPPPAPTPEKPAPIPIEESWREGIHRLGALARSEGRVAGDSTIPWALRARVLAWLAEPDIDPDLDQPESRGVRAVLRALSDSPSTAPTRAEDVRAAIRILEERAPLEIADLQLCLRADGFGDFQAIEPPTRRPGQPLVIYCKMDNVRHEATSAGFHSRLAAQVELIPEGGAAPAWTESLGTGEDTCRYRRNDYFINYAFKIPKAMAPGRYLLRLTERDLIADRTATREVPIAIVRD